MGINCPSCKGEGCAQCDYLGELIEAEEQAYNDARRSMAADDLQRHLAAVRAQEAAKRASPAPKGPVRRLEQ